MKQALIPAACKDTLEQGGRAKPQSKCKLRARAALCTQGNAQPPRARQPCVHSRCLHRSHASMR